MRSTSRPPPPWDDPPSGAPSPAIAPFNADQAKQHQTAWGQHLGWPVELTHSIGMKLVLIPPGEFRMGSPDSDSDAEDQEKPQHTVRITQPFFLGMHEVTQAQWEAVMGDNPSRFKGADRPVEMVSWDDCQEFIRRLNERSEQQAGLYRLPTEAEWEYACRAGSTTRYYFGDDDAVLGGFAWYGDNSNEQTHTVGQKKPNAWGLYDMHGNVWEWCQDWWWDYTSAMVSDPQGAGQGSHRVFRGGGWDFHARGCRSAFRFGGAPDERSDTLGFRLAFSLVSK
jgi:formylglycine-generating enzyme required for sulfatase activity